jgi:hypothetical protein
MLLLKKRGQLAISGWPLFIVGYLTILSCVVEAHELNPGPHGCQAKNLAIVPKGHPRIVQ